MIEFSDFISYFIGIGIFSVAICVDANSKGEKLNFFSVFGCITICACIFFGTLTKIQEYKRKSKIEESTFILQYNEHCSESSSNPWFLSCIKDSTKTVEISYNKINAELSKFKKTMTYTFTVHPFKIDSIQFYNHYNDDFLVLDKNEGWYYKQQFDKPMFFAYRICKKRTGAFESNCDANLSTLIN